MVSSNKVRTNITFSNEQYSKLDSYARSFGMSRNSLVVWFVGQGLMALDASVKAIGSVADKMVDEVVRDGSPKA